MLHEWRTNVWLIIELAIVALAIWLIMVILWMECKGLLQPLGFEPENVYTLDVKSIPSSSPYFLDEFAENFFEDRNELINRLRKNPNVEFVSLHNNFAPFEYNFAGNTLLIEGIPDSIIYYGNTRGGEPDIINVMGIRSLTGKTQEQLKKMMENNKILLSPSVRFEKYNLKMTDLIGKTAYVDRNSDTRWVIGDIVESVKRSDYEYNHTGVIIMPLDPIKEWGDIILKLKPGKIDAFIEAFNNDPSLSHLRNVYLSNLLSLENKADSLNREIRINIRLMVAISIFLLITIFLGLLGSFWFRVQQRISEIAIRKTFGAKKSDIFKRILGEGIILLVAGLILISACIWPVIKKITEFIGEEWYTILALEGITAFAMAIGIILSLWYPAMRAMRIEPAIAVKEE